LGAVFPGALEHGFLVSSHGHGGRGVASHFHPTEFKGNWTWSFATKMAQREFFKKSWRG
jgi:hypothetical protein